MLATGGSLAGTVQLLVDRGADHITCVCLLAAPRIALDARTRRSGGGTTTLVVAAIDERLNEHGRYRPRPSTPATGLHGSPSSYRE